MRRSIIIVGGSLAVVLSLAAIIGGMGVLADPAAPVSDAFEVVRRELGLEARPVTTASPDEPRPGVPKISEDQASKAREIMESDPTLRRLIDEGSPTIRLGLWTVDGESVGAAISLVFREPVTIGGSLPSVDFGEEGEALPAPGYRELTADFAPREVLAVAVLVDTNTNKVVQILPLPFSPGPRPLSAPASPLN